LPSEWQGCHQKQLSVPIYDWTAHYGAGHNTLKGFGGMELTTVIPFDGQLDEREPGAKVRGP
jgi:hypothetical protein